MDVAPPGSSVHEILQNTGVGCHFLLQEIFPTWGLNLGLLQCRQILCLSHQGSPVIYQAELQILLVYGKVSDLHDKPFPRWVSSSVISSHLADEKTVAKDNFELAQGHTLAGGGTRIRPEHNCNHYPGSLGWEVALMGRHFSRNLGRGQGTWDGETELLASCSELCVRPGMLPEQSTSPFG